MSRFELQYVEKVSAVLVERPSLRRIPDQLTEDQFTVKPLVIPFIMIASNMYCNCTNFPCLHSYVNNGD
jgi:hypothetical protein